MSASAARLAPRAAAPAPHEPDAVGLRVHRELSRSVYARMVRLQTRIGSDALAGRPEVHLGLLTGNTAGGAASKVRHFGLASFFPFGAYGCDHPDRNQLGPIALARAANHAGRSFSAAETWIIGDTPKDIDCARAIGARCLAVATGRFSTSDLESHGADRVVESLDQALDWI